MKNTTKQTGSIMQIVTFALLLIACPVAVSGADIYVAGTYYNGDNDKACYWKNGTKTDLLSTATTSYAYAIAVVE